MTRLDDLSLLETSKTARRQPIMNATPATNGPPIGHTRVGPRPADPHTAGLEAGLQWSLENWYRPTRQYLVPFDATASSFFADRTVDYDPSPTAGEQQSGTLLDAGASSSVRNTIAHAGWRRSCGRPNPRRGRSRRDDFAPLEGDRRTRSADEDHHPQSTFFPTPSSATRVRRLGRARERVLVCASVAKRRHHESSSTDR